MKLYMFSSSLITMLIDVKIGKLLKFYSFYSLILNEDSNFKKIIKFYLNFERTFFFQHTLF